jgi:hypothetical protein
LHYFVDVGINGVVGVYDKHTQFSLFGADKEWPNYEMSRALSLISTWLNPKVFKVEGINFVKTSSKAKWSDLLNLLQKKSEKGPEKIDKIVLTNKTEICVSKTGKIFRTVSKKELSYSFKNLPKRFRLILILEENGLTDTIELTKILGSKNENALRKMVGELNAKIGACLKLPKDENFIVGENGYKINKLYHLVFVD